MTYHGRKDNPFFSEQRNRPEHPLVRDSGDLRRPQPYGHFKDAREDHYHGRDHPWKHDRPEFKHIRYRNSSFYPTDRTPDPERHSRRNKSLSPSPTNTPWNLPPEPPKPQNSQGVDARGANAEEPETDAPGDSKVFLKYQQKAWKGKMSEPVESEKRASLLIRCLDEGITEEQVESVISDLAIRNGFSTPNSVVFKTFHTDTISGSLYCPEKNGQTPKYSEGYPSQYSLEKIAIVKFPSVSAAGRFMSTNKSRSVKIAGKEYYVEYDTSNNDSALKAGDDPMMPPVAEIANLLQKRRMMSDWNCPSCHFLNFAKRVVCMTCGLPKPSEAELESQNLAIELAALNQAQMLQSNLSDVSPWVIIKNIPGDADPAKLVLTVCKAVPEGPAHLQRCVYVIDTNADSKRGFMFAQFETSAPVEKYVAKRGDKKSELVQCGAAYHRLDVVRSREKNVAEELFKKVKMTNFKVNYEFDTVTSQVTLTPEDNTMTQLNKEYRSCKVKTTNIPAIQQHVSSTDRHSMSGVYFSNWVSDTISLPGGKPDTATFHYDPNSDYFFDHSLSLYYDAATTYYMSLTGNYYLWDEPSSSLKRVDPNAAKPVAQPQSKGTPEPKDRPKEGTNSIANILASAMKVAKVSQQNVQKLSSVITEKKQVSATTSRSNLNIVKTFDLDDNSDDECEMDLVEPASNEIKINLGSAGQSQTPEQRTGVDARLRPMSICFVCLRKFDSQDNLSIHERESKYHQALLTHSQAQSH